jgi:hypothetical protein
MKRLMLAVLLTTLAFGLFVPTAAAQDGGEDTTEPQTNPTARQRVNQAMAHLSGYLGLETTISLELIEADDENIPFVSYTWNPFTYTTSAMGCPAAGVDYERREVPAYRVLITVRGFGTYDYRVSQDGAAVLLCLFGGPEATSPGRDLSTGNALGLGISRTATNTGSGLVGALARIDQAMRNLSDYLDLRNTITYNRVANNDAFIAATEWAWLPVFYLYDGSGCPQPIPENTYDPNAVYGFEILLTVNNREYTYYSNVDGSLLILCINGRAARGSVIPGEE